MGRTVRRSCIKCGAEEIGDSVIKIEYIPAVTPSNAIERAMLTAIGCSPKPEHLRCTCVYCGYSWDEETVDQKKKKAHNG